MSIPTDTESIRELLRERFPMFSEPELQEELLKHVRLRFFKAGDTLLNYGDPLDDIPLLVSGTFKVLRQDDEGRELLLYYLTPGESCALSLTHVLGRDRSSLRIAVEEDSVAMLLPANMPEYWMGRFPSFRRFVLRTFQERFEELLKAVDSAAFRRLDERLVHYLKEKARVSQSRELRLTHQEIAAELHSSREVISRLLGQMEAEGLMELGRNLVRLKPSFSE